MRRASCASSTISGIELGETPEDMLGRLEHGEFADADVQHDAGAGSDHGYASHVREIDADTPARFNADPQRLYEASGSAGKVMVFAVGSTRSRSNRTQGCSISARTIPTN